ncbi:hypothetical protein [Synechococcus sp. PCC 6312]|uniref:hypothetical protein n=1 Tax=Synechococcus sp. (strain ATCC 27167 / PCC 6312) TaxID=195253 RepID=UPI00029F144D|nr:hypothetical protein [Synechococcus sp. PCC 6312]AFY60847.1 hypothetical protein Syn6312_1691 [Synechococcus sp. PCC 6312]
MNSTPWQQITLGQIYRATINTLERWGTAIRQRAESFVQTTIEPAWDAVKSFGDEPYPLLPPAKLQLMPQQPEQEPTTPTQPSPLLLATLSEQPNPTYWWLPFLRESFIPTPDLEKPEKKPKPKRRSVTAEQGRKVIEETPLPFEIDFHSIKLCDLRRRRTVFGLLYVAWTEKKLRTYSELKEFVREHTGTRCSSAMVSAFKRFVESGKIYKTAH